MGSVAPSSERLAQPLTFPLSGRTAPNRTLNAAMSEVLASWSEDVSKSGIPTPEYINLYKVWGEGGWGQVLTGNIQVDPVHLERKENAIIPLEAPFSGPRFEAYKSTATAAKANGSLLVGQISHAGRQVPAAVNPNPISASDIQLVSKAMGTEYAKPRAATQEDIDRIIESFAHAAEYLDKAGFDGVQLHGAHGYLIAQFMSPTTNKRTDKYGGSVTNRARLASEIAAAVRSRTRPDFILGIKLNSVEFQSEGITPEDAAELCRALDSAGFDYFELSGGTYESLAFQHRKESTKKREAFFLDFAETIMNARANSDSDKKPKVYITGGFQTIQGMDKALDVVDGVGLGKAACADPALAGKLVKGVVDSVPATTIPGDQFFASLVCANIQISQIATGQPLLDLSDPEAWQAAFKQALEAQAAAN